MSEITPGPWEIVIHENGRQSIIGRGGEDCCTKKNARAIAALPELLQIVETAVSIFGFAGSNMALGKDERSAALRLHTEARAALAKALGE